MKKIAILAAAVFVVSMIVGGVAFADKDVTGNGAPSGAHYNLNIIGVPRDKTADMTGNMGHRIFVDLSGKTKIMLSEGDFQVLDANGTDGQAAFQLPKPVITEAEDNNCISYSVYVRALGSQGGSAKMTTCAWDPVSEETVCSTESVLLFRGHGKQSFQNVSKELLTLCWCVWNETTGKWDCRRIGLFDEELQGYFWDYDNNGLKIAQLRFYMEPTCYDDNGWKCPTPTPTP